jgi:hypothetical protein
MSRNRGLFISKTKSTEKMNMRLEATQEELEQEQDLQENKKQYIGHLFYLIIYNEEQMGRSGMVYPCILCSSD